MPTTILRFPASDPAICTAVGEKVADLIRLRSGSGCGLFGPYIDLPAGRCIARVRFEGPSEGSVIMDLSAEAGEIVLASRVVDLGALEGHTVDLPTVLPRPLSACEVRLHYGPGVRADISAVEIELGWQSENPHATRPMSDRDWHRLLLPYNHPAPSPREDTRAFISRRGDPVRDFSVALALETVRGEGLAGDMAELGVYRGEMAVLYHQVCPEKRLYLFDTFAGFPKADLEIAADDRFVDTSVEAVKSRFSNQENIIFKKGYFPDSASGLEDCRFCFVMLDADIYNATAAGLEFFYPRMVKGGYIFAHDYTSYESNRGVSRAVDQFLSDKPERVIHLPDTWGSIVFRKT